MRSSRKAAQSLHSVKTSTNFCTSLTESDINRVIPILLLIARSKLVLDFALTIHFLHLIFTTLYVRAIPTALSWWALQAASSVLMVSLGVWACQWRELRPMAFGGKGKSKNDSPHGETNAGEGASEGVGYEMGHGRGRGKDGAGTYEMLDMATKEPA